MMIAAGDRRSGSVTRVLLISGNVVLQTLCHDAVNAWNAARPSSDLYDFSTVVDQWIPYIPWTWTVYYFGDIYVLFWGAYVVWKMPHGDFLRAYLVYFAMIVTGALVQYLMPGRSPWPEDGAFVQHWFHEQITFDPYVCLPSMHVALAVLPACMTFDVIRARSLRILTVVITVLITISTLTLKEHFALDAVAGIMLALICYAFWRKARRRTTGSNPTGEIA